jgi:hypothetical protein
LDLQIKLRSIVILFKNGGQGGYIAKITEALLSRLELWMLDWDPLGIAFMLGTCLLFALLTGMMLAQNFR